jgi:hypothetical protein
VLGRLVLEHLSWRWIFGAGREDDDDGRLNNKQQTTKT